MLPGGNVIGVEEREGGAGGAAEQAALALLWLAGRPIDS